MHLFTVQGLCLQEKNMRRDQSFESPIHYAVMYSGIGGGGGWRGGGVTREQGSQDWVERGTGGTGGAVRVFEVLCRHRRTASRGTANASRD